MNIYYVVRELPIHAKSMDLNASLGNQLRYGFCHMQFILVLGSLY